MATPAEHYALVEWPQYQDALYATAYDFKMPTECYWGLCLASIELKERGFPTATAAGPAYLSEYELLPETALFKDLLSLGRHLRDEGILAEDALRIQDDATPESSIKDMLAELAKCSVEFQVQGIKELAGLHPMDLTPKQTTWVEGEPQMSIAALVEELQMLNTQFNDALDALFDTRDANRRATLETAMASALIRDAQLEVEVQHACRQHAYTLGDREAAGKLHLHLRAFARLFRSMPSLGTTHYVAKNETRLALKQVLDGVHLIVARAAARNGHGLCVTESARYTHLYNIVHRLLYRLLS
jgi:hypothetical protein